MTPIVTRAFCRVPSGLTLFTLLLFFLLGGSDRPAAAQTGHALLTGADLSELPYQEAQGVKYYDGGVQRSLLDIARRSGWKVIRVRLWVSPSARPEDSVSSLENVTAFGKRLKAAGFQFLLDLHYSDTWADPAQQKKPAAWDSLPFPQLVAQVHDYTRDVLSHLRRNGAMPDMVQVGNETKNGLLFGSGTNGAGPQPGGGFWEKTPGGHERAVRLIAAGLAGVREGAAPARPPRTILHVPDGQDTEFVRYYFKTLDATAKSANVKLDYDVVGLSYYPANPWDKKAGYTGWAMARLSDSMNFIALSEHKPVLIVETSWPQAGRKRDLPGTPEFPLTPDGQVQFYQALMRAVQAVPGGMGLGLLPWEQDALNWDSVFDAKGNALPAVRVLGQTQTPTR